MPPTSPTPSPDVCPPEYVALGPQGPDLYRQMFAIFAAELPDNAEAVHELCLALVPYWRAAIPHIPTHSISYAEFYHLHPELKPR